MADSSCQVRVVILSCEGLPWAGMEEALTNLRDCHQHGGVERPGLAAGQEARDVLHEVFHLVAHALNEAPVARHVVVPRQPPALATHLGAARVHVREHQLVDDLRARQRGRRRPHAPLLQQLRHGDKLAPTRLLRRHVRRARRARRTRRVVALLLATIVRRKREAHAPPLRLGVCAVAVRGGRCSSRRRGSIGVCPPQAGRCTFAARRLRHAPARKRRRAQRARRAHRERWAARAARAPRTRWARRARRADRRASARAPTPTPAATAARWIWFGARGARGCCTAGRPHAVHLGLRQDVQEQQ